MTIDADTARVVCPWVTAWLVLGWIGLGIAS